MNGKWSALLLVMLVVCASIASSVPASFAFLTWNLNVKTVRVGGAVLTGAVVTMTNSTGPFQITVSSGGWANYTSITDGEVVGVKVQWEGSWVNGTFSETMNADTTVTATCKVYSFALGWFDQSWVPLAVPITSYRVAVVNGTNTGVLSPGGSYLFQNGSSSYFEVMWEGTDVTSATPSFRPESGCSACTLTKVYEITPVWTTYSGTALPEQITSYKMWASNGTLSGVLNPSLVYEEQWGIAAADQVIWQGSNVTPSTGLSFLPSAGSPTLKLNVFSITPSWRYSNGSPLPTPPTSYKWTPPNGTLSTTLAPSTAYWLQNGTTTVSAVMYGGADVTPSSGNTFDAIAGNPIINLNIAPLGGGVVIFFATTTTGVTSAPATLTPPVLPSSSGTLEEMWKNWLNGVTYGIPNLLWIFLIIAILIYMRGKKRKD